MSSSFFPSYANIPSEYENLFTNYSKEKFENTLIKLSNDFLDYSNNNLAGRLMMFEVVKNTGTLEDYLNNFKDVLDEGVYNYLNENKEEIQKKMIEYDYLNYHDQDFFSASTYIKTYLLKPFYKDHPLETPFLMYLRIIVYLYEKESVDFIISKTVRVALKYYTPASPTLFNVGTRKSQGSSCFLGTFGDDLDKGILQIIKDCGMISKHKGGLGLGISQLRHSSIKGGGMGSGITPVMKLVEKLILYVDQSGSRSGAATIHLHDWHIDFEDFILLRSTNQPEKNRLEFLNTCAWLSNLFLKRCEKDEEWTVFCPSRVDLYGKFGREFEELYLQYEKKIEEEVILYKELREKYEESRIKSMGNENNKDSFLSSLQNLRNFESTRIIYKKHKAKDLYNKMCTVECESGMPYVMYPDSINSKNNQANIGKITCSNLCTEIVEVTDVDRIASCNLHSISLKKFIGDKECLRKFKEIYNNNDISFSFSHFSNALLQSGLVNFSLLGEITTEVVNNLNKLIDKNFYPVEEKTKDHNLKTRPLGIGVSGFDEAIKMCDFIFESNEANYLNKLFFACMYWYALKASMESSSNEEPYFYFDKGSFEMESVKDKITNSVKVVDNGDGTYTHTFNGSPFNNGLLQFDLWQHRASVLEIRGELDTSVYNKDDDLPVPPKFFGVNSLGSYSFTTQSDFTRGWSTLKHLVLSKGVSNSLLLTCMPTASTAQILCNTESTEIGSANMYSRKVNSGEFIVINKLLLEDFKDINLYNNHLIEYLRLNKGSIQNIGTYYENFDGIDSETRENYMKNKSRVNYLMMKYKTMYEVSQKDILQKARCRAIYIDQTQSTNIFLDKASVAKVRGVHYYGNKLGLKTGMYYLRQKGDNQNSVGISINPVFLEYKKKEKEIKKEKECLGEGENGACLMCGS